MKALRIAGIALAALLVVAAGVFTWAVRTESGTRSVLALARGWLPPGLTIGEARGTISGPLHVINFRYHDPSVGMDLVVDDAVLEFAALSLLSRRLHVQSARVTGVRLDLFPSNAPPGPPGTRDPWRAPLDMQVDSLELVRGELRRPDAAPFSILRARLAASWIGPEIVARTFELESPDGQLSLSGKLAPPAPRLQQLNAKYRWRIGEHEWSGTLDAAGARESLDLNVALDTPVQFKASGTLAGARVDKSGTSWRAHLSVPRFDPHPLVDTDAFKTLALELDADGDENQLALRGVLSVDQERVLIEQLGLLRHENLLEVTALKVRLNSQPAAVTGSAKLALDRASPSSAQLAWDEFHLPDAWAGANFRCSGKLALTSAAQRFAVNGQARIARADRYSTLALRVDGSKESLHIDQFELTQIPGSLSVRGNIELAQPVRWTLQANSRQFDPSLFFEAWPGALDFTLDTTGLWKDSGPQANFKLAALSGRLRGRPISGSGDVSVGPDRRPSGRVQLQSGGAALEAVASGGAQPRVDATLKVAAIEEWRKDITGALNVSATALGRWPTLDLDARITGSQLRSGSSVLDSVNLHLRAKNPKAPSGSAELNARGLELAGFRFANLAAKLEGDEAAHALRLDAKGDPVSVGLHASGSLDRKWTWNGLVDQLTLDVKQVPPLALAEPTRITLARESFQLGNTCLKGGQISLCGSARKENSGSARNEAGTTAANYSIRALPLDVLVALAAPESDVSVEGTLDGGGDLRRAPDGRWTGKATLASTEGALAQRGDEKAIRLEYRDFGIDVDLTPEAARAQLRGVLPRQGELGGTFTMGVGGDDPALSGRGNLKLRDLGPVGLWVPQLANLRGSGELAASVTGTLHAPKLELTMTATGLDVEVPALGVHLREGNFSAALKPGGGFDASGSISSGDGKLNISGNRDPDKGIELKVGGAKFLAANVPGARVTVAPDLALVGKSGKLALTGSVKIEDADVNLEKLSIGRSYRASPDVVVIDRKQEEKEASLGLNTDVRVILGDGVKLAGFGLDSTVGGELRVLEEGDQPSRATGEIQVKGTYEAFGRKLTIARGRLQFAGTTLDDPQLDILAERQLQDVTAKLSVTGTAQHPKLDVFTDPAMSQTDAMSYLLTGKAASDTHGEEGQMVTTAAQSVGSVLGNRLAKRIGGKVGFVDEIGVEQNADLGGNAFTVGKYLSPKFFISYGVGLFEPGSTMTVRYEFSKHWSLEANQAPEDGHAGIRYRIEK